MDWATILTILVTGGLFKFIEWIVERFDTRKQYVTNTLMNQIIEKLQRDIDAIKESHMIQLQANLEASMQKCLDRGYTTINQYRSITNQYSQYTSLGGNDFIHGMYVEYDKLPKK